MFDIFRRGGQQINLCQLNLRAVTFPLSGDVVASATPCKLNLQQRLYKGGGMPLTSKASTQLCMPRIECAVKPSNS